MTSGQQTEMGQEIVKCPGTQQLALVGEVSVPDDVVYSPSFKKQRPPILTPEELCSAEVLTPGRLGPCVRRISQTKAVKSGSFVSFHEAETLKMLHEKAPSVPVPRVYNAYRTGKETYIVMDYISGSTLQSCWDTLSGPQKSSVLSQLRKHVTTWRKISGEYYGAVGNGPCGDSIFLHPFYHEYIRYGPFKSRQEFNNGVVQALRNSRPNSTQYNLDLEPKIMETQGDEMIFTHGDLNLGNILLNSEGKVSIVDWGNSGFSIKEREFVEANWGAWLNGDWEAHLPLFLQEYGPEYQFWNHVVNDMRMFSGV